MADGIHVGARPDGVRALGVAASGAAAPGAALSCGPVAVDPAPPVQEAMVQGALVQDALARLIESEILPRLMLAHRAPAAPPRAPAARAPGRQEVTDLSALLLAPGPVDVAAAASALRDGGLPLPSLLLDLLAPASRHLGELWEEDICDFLAVTEALGRLQSVARHLCAELEDDAVPPAGHSVLLLPCPGETHLFGLSIVASFFREAGWDVTVARPGSGADAAGLLRSEWFDAVGLSLSCDVSLPALAEAIPELRRASRNPGIGVLVGGPYFARHGVGAEAVGADACAPDGRLAPAAAEALLDRRAQAC